MADAKKSIDIDVNLDSKTAQAGLKGIKSEAAEASAAVGKLDGQKVDINTSGAKQDVDGLIQKVSKLADKPAKILLQSNAETIATDMASLLADLNRLDAEDPEVQVKVDQLNSLSGDLEKVTGKLKELGDTKVDIRTDVARQNIDEVGKSADSSKSVLANMVGNSVQDLGNLGGIAGSTGVAIGQMGEYFADATLAGEGFASAIKSFALVAGPVGALALVTAVLPSILEAVSGKSKQLVKDTEDLTKAFAGLEDADPASRFEELGKKIDEVLQDSPHLAKSFKDLGISGKDVADTATTKMTPALQRVKDEFDGLTTEITGNIRVQQEAAAKSGVAITAYDAEQQALEEVAAAHGLTKQELKDRLAVEGEAVGKVGELTEATKAAKEQDDIRRGVLGNLTDAQGDNTEAIKASQEATDALAQAQEEATQRASDQRDALAALNDTLQSNALANADVFDAQLRANQALQEYGKQAHDGKVSADEHALALNSVYSNLIQVAGKTGEAAAAQSGLTLETDRTVASITTQIQYLEAVADTLSPDDPLRTELGNYIAQLNGIKEKINTDVTANTDEAMRKLRELQAYINSIGGGFDVPIGLPNFDSGGVVPGPRGAPTLAVVHGGETVIPTNQGPTANGAGMNLTINVNGGGPGLGRQIVDELTWAMRTGGLGR